MTEQNLIENEALIKQVVSATKEQLEAMLPDYKKEIADNFKNAKELIVEELRTGYEADLKAALAEAKSFNSLSTCTNEIDSAIKTINPNYRPDSYNMKRYEAEGLEIKNKYGGVTKVKDHGTLAFLDGFGEMTKHAWSGGSNGAKYLECKETLQKLDQSISGTKTVLDEWNKPGSLALPTVVGNTIQSVMMEGCPYFGMLDHKVAPGALGRELVQVKRYRATAGHNSIAATTVSLTSVAFELCDYKTLTPVTDKELTYSNVDLSSWLIQEAGEQFMEAYQDDIITGLVSSFTIEGLKNTLTTAYATVSVNKTVGSITASDINTWYWSQNMNYSNGAIWLIHPTIVAAMDKLVGSSTGTGVWNPNLAQAPNLNLKGNKWFFNSYLDLKAKTGCGAIILNPKFYRVWTGKNMQLKIIDQGSVGGYNFATSQAVGFRFVEWRDGRLLTKNALVKVNAIAP